MSKVKNVLSLFDGISGGYLALKRAGIDFNKYYASEICESAMTISKFRNKDIIQLGDIRNITKPMINDKIDMIIGGSPCQGFSFAGYRKGMTQKEDIEITSLDHYLKLKAEGFEFVGQSYLFWEYIRLVKELKPKYFLLENVLMNKKWMRIITRELGVLPIHINSNLVSFQNRDRLYWTNIPDVLLPTDLNINVGDVIPGAIGGYGKRGTNKGKHHPNGKIKWELNGTTRKDHKINCTTTSRSNNSMVTLLDGSHRNLTVDEVEKGQTLPEGYTNVPGVSQTQRWHGIGNGWTIDVIAHIFKGLK
jgi:DNA (cytosine-5)-methyltransferase 3A